MRKKIISSLTTFALLTGAIAGVAGIVGSSSVKAAHGASTFKDVPTAHWASSAIDSAVEQGYFKGYADGTFKPGAPVTKAEMASILARLSDQPELQTPAPNPFTDVPEWAKNGVSTAIAKGFIDPSSYKGKLDAQAPLSRGEMANWLTQGLRVVNSDYGQALSDVTNTVIPAKEYFTGTLAASQKNAVAVALGTGLMSVANDKTFGVNRTTTRAEVAVLIARYASVAKTKPADIQGLNELRQVGLTGTNLSVIAPRYQKPGPEKFSESYDYSKITGDFSKVRNQELVTVTKYATAKIKNWIIINPYVKEKERSIYYPAFVDEKDKLLRGAYYSFIEYDFNIINSMNRLQAGSLFSSPTINPLTSPSSKAFKDYAVPHINSLLSSKGFFVLKNPGYWGEGLLHFDKTLNPEVHLTLKDGTDFFIVPN
ncbi:S-layer homology domain-containing protein [Paenibacillus barcinonensis]|uniref:S-layer family protein n=1 Tax=Paenibacillus barcinonensis TaxID=198119 RepID=A0A2V4VQ09_PAEBA|nr:S-layer homology domain-containing protein [Paenibacillus barcinonensis]PYE44408.1 S-layer family protein [Paenibacillus barcinonensis]QKS58065.1 S-layer homology domain-containing protein [Paenibacillus barcinonensis]